MAMGISLSQSHSKMNPWKPREHQGKPRGPWQTKILRGIRAQLTSALWIGQAVMILIGARSNLCISGMEMRAINGVISSFHSVTKSVMRSRLFHALSMHALVGMVYQRRIR